MPLTLIATPGAATANALCDLLAAQAIIDATPNAATAWGTDPALQTQALIAATTMLAVVQYLGIKSDFAQALPWPRYGVYDPDYGDSRLGQTAYTVAGQWGFYLDNTTIPARMVRACVMLALEILRAGPADVWGVDPTLDVQREQVDVLATDYVAPWFRRVGLRRYPSVWREIYPLTAASGSSVVERA